MGYNVAQRFRPTQLDSDDTILVGERNVDTIPHRVASLRLVLVVCVHPTNTSAPETEVDLQSDDVGRRSASSALLVVEPGSTVPAFSGPIRNAQHPAVVVPASGRIQLHNSFEALSRNDEDDVPIDGNAVFFGDESETESLPDSDRGHGESVEEAFPMEARPRFANFGLEALDGVDLSEEFHKRPHAICFGRDYRRETPTKRGAGGTRLEVVLPHSKIIALPTSARRYCPQRQVGRQVETVCSRRVVVFAGRKQQVVRSCKRGTCQEEKKRVAQRRS